MIEQWGEPHDLTFFEGDAHELAQRLLGQMVSSEIDDCVTVGRIVEVEVYGGVDDPACHADRGVPTDRTRSMYAAPGTAYVYRIYGMYDCLNVVAPRGRAGKASAILVRALEPVAGLDAMRERRNTDDVRKLTSGPGKLCQALGITRALDGHVLVNAPLRIHASPQVDRSEIDLTSRIGLNEKTCGESTHFLWRYVLRDSPHRSR